MEWLQHGDHITMEERSQSFYQEDTRNKDFIMTHMKNYGDDGTFNDIVLEITDIRIISCAWYT